MATRRQLPGFGFSDTTENFDFSQPLDVPQAAPALPPTNQFMPPPQPAPTAPTRWSTGLERMPGWLEGQDQQTQGFYQDIYNRTDIDPGDYIGQLEGQYRDARASQGLKTDATSANILPLLDDFSLSGEYGKGENASQSSGQSAPQSDIMSELRGFFQGGQPNQDIINRRTEGARENLNRFAKSRNATNRAALANRGLIGDGPEQTAQNRVEEDIADRYSGAVSQIYADELGRGDDRMLESLRLAAGLESGNKDRQLSETLGLGNLALGNYRAQTDYDLGLGNLGLGQDQLAADIQSGGIDQLLTLLQLLTQGAGQSAEGYY